MKETKLTFEGSKYDLGDMSSQATIPFEFPYEGSADNIEWVGVQCGGCTLVTNIERGKISGEFKAVFGGGQQFKDKPIEVQKEISICETGNGEYFLGQGPTKRKIKNREKVIHTLMITGTITEK